MMIPDGIIWSFHCVRSDNTNLLDCGIDVSVRLLDDLLITLEGVAEIIIVGCAPGD
jgi:hypothetical protein